jgi:hypothetical protein
MFPILNPNGLGRGSRKNRDEIDLNRDYRNSRSLETKSHIETLLNLGRFDASMMLHEDYEGIGAYLYEQNDTLHPGLGAKIIAAMGLHVPIDLRSEIEEAMARGGVISRRDLIATLGRLEERTEWAEATYLTVYHTEVSYTIETPKPFPIARWFLVAKKTWETWGYRLTKNERTYFQAHLPKPPRLADISKTSAAVFASGRNHRHLTESATLSDGTA